MTEPTERRTRYAAAMARRDGDTWPTAYENDEPDYLRRADAAIAVADAEQVGLRTRISELESSCRDTDRLRKDWVEMRDRAEELDDRAKALAAATVPASTDRAALAKLIADAVQGVLPTSSSLACEVVADAVLAVLPAPAACSDPIECSHEAALGEAEAATEAYRLALSQALGLGTGANWEAIRDRGRDVVAEVAELTQAVRPAASGPGGAAGEQGPVGSSDLEEAGPEFKESAGNLNLGRADGEPDSYAERVNAPLSDSTITALNQRLRAGDIPVHTVRRRAAGETQRPRCPHCQMPHDLTPDVAAVCASIRASIAASETQHPECSASRSGECLREAESETACDTETGECVHGGKPGGEERQGETQAVRRCRLCDEPITGPGVTYFGAPDGPHFHVDREACRIAGGLPPKPAAVSQPDGEA